MRAATSGEKEIYGNLYGTHRVLDKQKVFPQSAIKLDNDTSKLYDDEIKVTVDKLCLDSASFRQLKESCANDVQKIGIEIQKIITTRGKMHNPATGSGGVLAGVIDEIGARLIDKIDAKVGDRIVTLASLTLTPLQVQNVIQVNIKNGHILVRGSAILFETAPFAKIPADMNEDLALAVLDVCGAAIQTSKLVKQGDLVFIMGSGKSGMLCAYAARSSAKDCKIVMLAYDSDKASLARTQGIVDKVVVGDATNPIHVKRILEKCTGGRLADLTLNCVNSELTEMTSALSTRDGGIAYFFNMNTNFDRAALGAEGVSKDVRMVIGNGFSNGHADYALRLVRDNPKLQKYLELLLG